MSYDLISVGHNPSMDALIDLQAASKLGASDSSLFSFSNETQEFTSKFMGWTTLCSNPPFSLNKIQEFADKARQGGLTDVLLIGQGGSTQASMTMAEVLKSEGKLDIGFYTMDSMSGEYVNWVWDKIDPQHTIIIVSSKSGSTLEPMSVFKCVWERMNNVLGNKAPSHFVAITDPNSSLEKMANELGFAYTFAGEPTVGGRFSALSVFGLVPFALMGIDICELINKCKEAENACKADNDKNPALKLASFMYEGSKTSRDKICFSFSLSCESFGLWLEQLIAESSGKQGKGILPNTENDYKLLAQPNADKISVVYSMSADTQKNIPDLYGCSLAPKQKQDEIKAGRTPCICLEVESSQDLACHMVVWEYAISMYSALAKINPFDQPDVESTKKAVKQMLGDFQNGIKTDPTTCRFMQTQNRQDEHVIGFEISRELLDKSCEQNIDDALNALFSSINDNDFFCINAFIPYFDNAKMQVLERIRHSVAKKTGSASCLEIGPRYLHSIGQFQKGGYNKGVYILLASPEDINDEIPQEGYSLGYLAATQAKGDFCALDSANRRAICIMLKNNDVDTLSWLEKKIDRHLSA